MKRSFTQKLILLLSAAIVASSFIFLLVYPLVKDLFFKKGIEVAPPADIDKRVLQKVDRLKDNTVYITDESYKSENSPTNNLNPDVSPNP